PDDDLAAADGQRYRVRVGRKLGRLATVHRHLVDLRPGGAGPYEHGQVVGVVPADRAWLGDLRAHLDRGADRGRRPGAGDRADHDVRAVRAADDHRYPDAVRGHPQYGHLLLTVEGHVYRGSRLTVRLQQPHALGGGGPQVTSPVPAQRGDLAARPPAVQ